MKILKYFLGLFLLFPIIGISWSQAYAQGSAGRGMNVTSSVSSQDIIELAELLRPKLIRYTISFGTVADTASLQEYSQLLDQTLTKFDTEIAPVLKQYGMKAVLSLGTPPGGFSSRKAPYPQMRVFSEAASQQAIQDLWDTLSKRYAQSDVVAAYHLLSEPATGRRSAPGLLDWYSLQKKIAKTVRTNDSSHPIILTSAYSDPNKIGRARIKGVKKVWYAIHFYFPPKFLQQGVEIPANSSKYPSKSFNKGKLAKRLSPVVRFARKYNAKIFVAEFTTTRYAPKNSGVKYLKDLLSLFKKYKWNWTFHAWAEADAWDVRIPAAEDNGNSTLTKRGEVLKKYFR